MNSYPFGSVILLATAFRTAKRVLVDPTVVTLYIRGADGTEITYTNTDITKISTGVYNRQFYPDTSGVWKYRWEGKGEVIAANEKSFEVKPSDFGGALTDGIQ